MQAPAPLRSEQSALEPQGEGLQGSSLSVTLGGAKIEKCVTNMLIIVKTNQTEVSSVAETKRLEPSFFRWRWNLNVAPAPKMKSKKL